MMESRRAHSIKHRTFANDEFMTPGELAKRLVALVPLQADNFVVDPCPGEGAFINALPPEVESIGLTEDFFTFGDRVDWLISNPPYSKLDLWLSHSFSIADIGVAYLLGLHNITPRRIEMANRAGFGIVSIHLCKVFQWFGISAFCVWQKGRADIITYDRIVWR